MRVGQEIVKERRDLVTPADIKDIVKEHYGDPKKGLIPDAVIFIGNPGIGKSEGVRQAAQEIARDYWEVDYVEYHENLAKMLNMTWDEIKEKYFILVDLRLYEVTPEDFFIPYPTETGEMRYQYQHFVELLSDPKTKGILFIDEITIRTRPDIKAILYKILLDREIGFKKLSDNVMIVGAGNPPGVGPTEALPSPVLTRAWMYEVECPTYEEWKAYMDAEKTTIEKKIKEKTGKEVTLPMSVPQFIDMFLRVTKRLCPSEPEIKRAEKEAYPCPRAWTRLAHYFLMNNVLTTVDFAKWLQPEGKTIPERNALIIAAVGRAAASDLIFSALIAIEFLVKFLSSLGKAIEEVLAKGGKAGIVGSKKDFPKDLPEKFRQLIGTAADTFIEKLGETIKEREKSPEAGVTEMVGQLPAPPGGWITGAVIFALTSYVDESSRKLDPLAPFIVDELLKRDILKGGGVLHPGIRLEMYYSPIMASLVEGYLKKMAEENKRLSQQNRLWFDLMKEGKYEPDIAIPIIKNYFGGDGEAFAKAFVRKFAEMFMRWDWHIAIEDTVFKRQFTKEARESRCLWDVFVHTFDEMLRIKIEEKIAELKKKKEEEGK